MPNRAVLIGAGGFIGKALEAHLLSRGFDVLGLTSEDIDLTSNNATKDLASLLKEQDSVVFLAALTPDKGRDEATFNRNIDMANAVFSALDGVSLAHFTYVSSDAVYPYMDEPITENSNPLPEDLYGEMHRAREVLSQNSVTCPIAIIRPTMVYGMADSHNSYGPNRFRRSAFEQGVIQLFGKGEENRDFIYINDVVKIFEMVLKNRFEGALNLATGVSVTFADLAQRIAGLFDDHIEIMHMDRSVPITHRQFDIAKIHTAFPDLVLTTLNDGLARSQREF